MCRMKYLKIIFSFIGLLFSLTSLAQQAVPGSNDDISKKISEDTTSKLFVAEINITGNKRTKGYIILREMKFKAGDSILTAKLYDLVQQSRALVHNTSL